MNAKAFVDTNVLVYAHDSAAGENHDQAKSLVTEIWANKNGVISTQVLQEFYVTIRKKVFQPGDGKTARRWLTHYLNWQVIANDSKAILRAIEIEQRYQLSFWDSMIVQAANEAHVTLLYS
ncbi:MAG: PIN domain-containing protein, partial [Pseudomonadales bacterium]